MSALCAAYCTSYSLNSADRVLIISQFSGFQNVSSCNFQSAQSSCFKIKTENSFTETFLLGVKETLYQIAQLINYKIYLKIAENKISDTKATTYREIRYHFCLK